MNNRTYPALVMTAALLLLPATAPAERLQHLYRGPDGQPLPFATPEEAAEFLATAEEIDSKELSTGITKPRKLTLEKDGVRAHAIFHHVDRREQKIRRLENGAAVLYLRDSYRGQVAAFLLSRLLGMQSVPPTAIRRSKGHEGSVQLWIEEAMTEQGRRDKGLEHPDHIQWLQQKTDQWVFDNLINNIDRNTGNTLIDPSWNVWLIDHTRSFGADRKLPYPERVRSISRELWSSLRRLDPKQVRGLLKPYLTRGEIKALLARHELLIERIEERIARLGEDRIVFTFGHPWVTEALDPTP